ncbi:MAG: acetate--CoA ligase family protein [Gemmatimonadota bacterium]|nr:MAG: acetate--CoA ligase family protein [Gemmatimonadota bacterium]
MDIDRIAAVVEGARADGRDVLLESEGLELLAATGIATPEYAVVAHADALSSLDLAAFPGDRVVLKVLSPDILHKSAVGGVAALPGTHEAVGAAIRQMDERFRGKDVRGYLVVEHVTYDRSPGGELLLGIRWTDDFGPVVTCGLGGIHAEFLAEALGPGRGIALASACDLDPGSALAVLEEAAVTQLATGALREQAPRLELGQLVDFFLRFARLASKAMPEYVSELEVNPLAAVGGRLLPLDVLVKCEPCSEARPAPRPLHKVKNLLEPDSLAIVGVSERMNPGRLILNNLLRAGFDRARIHLVKSGSETIEGCRCYPDLESLPGRVDLLILAVAAAQVPELLTAVVEHEKAESIILIPGGLEEKEGSEDIVARVRSALERARSSDWGGPVINGGNSMGIRSRPGGYDTTFIPDYKLRGPSTGAYPIAFISQSGAFYVAKGSKLGLDPKYAISIGNQMDLTIGDFMTYLKDDDELAIFAVYAEGFQRLDGARFIDAAREITAKGKAVIYYRAGRSAAGAAASASHTAAIAGDYLVSRELARHAGVVVCETTADFEDMVRLFALLGDRPVKGRRLGAISNAGFECVSMADHLGDFQLASLTERTRAGLLSLLSECRLDAVVDLRNPVDVTPIMPDAPFEEACRLVIEDDNVDAAIVGCVPLTPALHTLAPGEGHAENVYRDDSFATRLVRLKDQVNKPWIAAVDGGPMFDPMARLLEENGIPTFRTADRALRLFSRFCSAKLRR